MQQDLILSALTNFDKERMQRAVCGLADGTMVVTLTRQTDSEIRAFVKNGNGAEYGVCLTAALTTCNCKDAMYRGVTACKHAIATALHLLSLPVAAPEQPAAPQQPTTHLMWSDGTVVCGEQQPEKVLVRPWPMNIIHRPDDWPELTLCAACLAERLHPSQMKEAA